MDGGSEGELSISQKESPVMAPTADDTGAALASEAASLYQNKSYQECIALLQQLLLKKESDPKVIHNIALSEFHRDGSTDPYKLLDVLEQVKRKCEELAKAADEQLEGIGNNVSSPNGSTNGAIAKPTSAEAGGVIEDYDISFPCLNTAILYYHLKQYASALSVLEPLFANIEPVDESCALQICLLMLDITLASRRADKAATVLRYIEKFYGLGQGSENAWSFTQSVTPQTSLPSAAAMGGLEGRNFSVGINSTAAPASLVNSPNGDSSLAPSAGEETFEEDAFSIGLEIDGVRNLPTRLPAIEKSPGTDLKLLMHLYRVRYLQLTHGLKAAKREVKLALNLSKDNLSALLLKAQLEYSRGNYRKAMKLLTTCSNRGEAAVSPLILSNLGCVYHFLKKDHSALLYFVKALQMYAGLSRERPLKLATFSQDKSLSVYYNAGLVQLCSGDPVLAARSFQKSAPLFYNKPLFWLRLAECCISALEKGLLPDVSAKSEKLSAVLVGQGRYRRLVLPSGTLNSSLTAAAAVADNVELPFFGNGKSRQPIMLSMRLAKKCLQNALYLLDHSDKAEEATAQAKEGEELANNVGFNKAYGKGLGSFASSVASFEQEEKQEKEILRLCLLANLAFVELCLENPIQALNHAESVLLQQQVQLPKAYAFLAHVYAAEALCLLGRVKEAEGHLRNCMMDWTSSSAAELGDEEGKGAGGGGFVQSGEGSDDPKLADQIKFQKYTGAEARASLYVNFAAVHAIQGELPEARQCALQAIAIAPGSTFAVLLLVYVELAQGRSKEALAMLKRCRHLSVSKIIGSSNKQG